ncbi:MAG: hypothetical protein HZC41_16165 [Chloroflexi bacterium]|nr:hypothetical protein [Chloroflexota bacterium]
MKQPYRILWVLVLTALLVLVQASASAQELDDGALNEEVRQLIDDVRGATADFRDVSEAEAAGYSIFQDCFKDESIGGMGQHYVNGELAGDDVVDPLKPEALVYEPREDGSLILVAMEYLVFQSVWDPDNTGREAPTLFGQEFHLKTNIPDTPPVWALHIWLWTHNPEGLFADYNPIVFCPDTTES